tara:strand:- start:192 stop:431 length:240 start_codon:yes stop_codon:yes gene_type:complete
MPDNSPMMNFILNQPVRFATTVLFTSALINISRAALGYELTTASVATGMAIGAALSFFSQQNRPLPVNLVLPQNVWVNN